MEAILSGDPFETEDALRLGIIDEIIQGDLVAGAIAFAKRKAAQGGKHPLVRDKTDKVLADRANPAIFKEAEAFLARRLRGQFNGQMAYECVKAAVQVDGFDAGMKVERDNFQKCLTHPQRAAMIHVFFAERQAARIPDIPAETQKKDIKSAATVGAGLMGGGIAMNFANVGIPVKVLEVSDEALQKGLSVIQKNYARMVQGGRITQAQMDERVALIQGTTDYSALADADVVIEAVYENLDLKKQIFKKLDETMKPGAILASNTSALDIDQMAAMTKRPQDVVGMHFFSPANVMQLLEVVRGEKSAKPVIATAMALGKTIDKIPVLSRNERGFIGNRMLGGYTQQAGEIILQGALPEQVDKVIYDFGFNMGPFAMNDLVGLDLGWRARQMAKVKPEDVPFDRARRRQTVRDGPIRTEDERRLLQVRRRQPSGNARSGRGEADRRNVEGTRHHASSDQRRRGVETLPLSAHQHRRAAARKRRGAARSRHRRGVHLRLRLPEVSRRTDVLRRSDRPRQHLSGHPEVPSGIRRSVETFGAARAARQGR